MKLYVTSTAIDAGLEVDISWQLNDGCCVTNADQLFCRMLVKICNWVVANGGELSDVYCDSFDGNGETGFDLGLSSGADFFERLREVALLAWYIHEKGTWIEEARIFAVIENVGLKWFNFEDLESQVEDDYVGEYPDDAEEWARKWMNETDQAIPESLEQYFDYEQYGKDMLRDAHSTVEWNGQRFLYAD